MSRVFLIPLLACAAVSLAACQPMAPVRGHAATAPSAELQAQPAPVPAPKPTVAFRLGQTEPSKSLTPVQAGNITIWVLPQPVLERSDLNTVRAVKNGKGQAYVQFTFNTAGARKLAAATQRNTGKLIVLSIDGRLSALAKIGGPMAQGSLFMPAANETQANAQIQAILGAGTPDR